MNKLRHTATLLAGTCKMLLQQLSGRLRGKRSEHTGKPAVPFQLGRFSPQGNGDWQLMNYARKRGKYKGRLPGKHTHSPKRDMHGRRTAHV